MSELTFEDHAAVEILPALLKHWSYLSDQPEKQAAEQAYRYADALAVERVRRLVLATETQSPRRVERVKISDLVTLTAALRRIAQYQRGGLVVTGEHSGDRDEMIGLAREALREVGVTVA